MQPPKLRPRLPSKSPRGGSKGQGPDDTDNQPGLGAIAEKRLGHTVGRNTATTQSRCRGGLPELSRDSTGPAGSGTRTEKGLRAPATQRNNYSRESLGLTGKTRVCVCVCERESRFPVLIPVVNGRRAPALGLAWSPAAAAAALQLRPSS